MRSIADIRKEANEFMNKLGFIVSITELTWNNRTELIIEPSTRKTGTNRKDFFDGMQIIYNVDGFEVSEYQAGKDENELHIFKVTNSLKVALKDLVKGNKRKPIKIYN